MNYIFKFCAAYVAFSVTVFVIAFFGTSLLTLPSAHEQFGMQTTSFLQGRMDIQEARDTIYFEGKYYWHQNPFPSLILIPGQIIFGSSFRERYCQLLIIPILGIFLYKLARIKKFSRYSSIFLVFSFMLGSVMIGLIAYPASWYFSQVVATTLLTILLFEFETRKRYFVLGLAVSLIIATRPSAAFIGVLLMGILIYNLLKKGQIKPHLQNLIKFIAPIIFLILLLLFYNFLRFQDPFYDIYKNVSNEPIASVSRSFGVINPIHIPSNFYSYFLISFVPVTHESRLVFPFFTFSAFGLSFFIVSPFFMYAFKALKATNWLIKGYWVIVGLTLFFLLNYYWMGYFTYGPRYTADFLPILYLLTLYALKPPDLTKTQISIILASATLNTYLFISPSFIPG